MRNPSFQSYVSATIGTLFSETEKAVAQTKSKLETGLPLHSGDIARIERTYHEEWFDAKAFRPFVCSNAYKFWGEPENQCEKTEKYLKRVENRISATALRVTDILKNTSVSMAFYSSALAYVERYEMEHGFAKIPGLNSELLFRLIGEEFEHAKCARDILLDGISDKMAEIQWRIAYEMQVRGNDSPEFTKSVIERSVLAEGCRKASDRFFVAMASDFECLRKRLLLHGIKISYHFDS